MGTFSNAIEINDPQGQRHERVEATRNLKKVSEPYGIMNSGKLRM